MSQPSIPNHGCTCGHCVGGWLSARMVYQLGRQAEAVFAYANPEEHMNVDPSAVAMLPYSDYLPRSLFRQTLHPGFYWGYMAVFLSIFDIFQCLVRNLLHQQFPDWTLTADAVNAHVLANYPQAVEHFFAQGGQVVYALDAIMGMAKDESGKFDKSGRVFVRLPQCDKDYDFALVRKMAGLAANRRWGPYSIDS
ncbi:hypothetical protein BDZ89DRAFT_1154895 [Hymenopellis radicata]|nr:hypothetical protein BDZ89DRAFT_1154895 [Hymenopellis radicata]